MDEDFFRVWFSGFSEGLEKMTNEGRSKLLKPCARRCADTGVLDLYKQHYQNVNGKRDLFYAKLEELGGCRGQVIVPDKEYIIIFPECSCDLHFSIGIYTPCLCECSRQSIIYIAQEIWKCNFFSVENEGTVLSGEKECRFRIRFND